jgi:crotonobetainyl-CoA hydratase
MGMMLTGRAVSADEGLQLGFVNEVVPAGEVLDCARRWADEIIACSPLSLRATKQAALAAQDVPLEASIAAGWALPAMKKMLGSEDAIEGPKAFAERRTPAWQGR